MTWVIHCYAVLAIVSNSYPPLQGRLPTRYSPVRNSSARCKHQASAFYLHVLGTPPAFILSQDQTLIKIIVCLKLILSLTDLLFFYCSVTTTLVIAPCTLVRLVQFSKVFVNFENSHREDRIRTCDPLVPNQVLYQAELLPDKMHPRGVEPLTA